MTNLYARAYVRGLNADLVAAGTVVYPSKIAMDIASNAVADHCLRGVHFEEMPNGVPIKVASDALAGLLQISEDLCNEAGGHSLELSKVASAVDSLELARYDALELLKLAEEEARNPVATAPASTGPGKNPEATNSAPNASATGVAVAAPAKENGAVGVPSVAVVGTEHAIGGHGTTPSNDKLASFARRMTAKIAATGGTNPKTTESIPETAQSATGKASTIVSKENPGEGAVPSASEVGTEQAQKTASYLARVEKVASAVIPYLPSDLPEYAHVAHIRALSKLACDDQGKYLYLMYGAYGMSSDEALGFAQQYVKRADDMKVDEDEEKDEGKGDDGSSDAAVAAALDEAAEEIEEAQKSEKKEDDAKIASVDRLRRTVAG